MFGSCVTSSKRLIVFAALTDNEYSSLTKSVTRSVIDFFIVFGVVLVNSFSVKTI